MALAETVTAHLHALGCPFAGALNEQKLCGAERYRTLEWLVTRYSPAVVELCTERDFQPAAEPDRIKRLMSVCTAIGVCSADDEPLIRGERSRADVLECMQQLCTLIGTAEQLHAEPRVAAHTEWERSSRLLTTISAHAQQSAAQPASSAAADVKDAAVSTSSSSGGGGGGGGVFSDECVLFPAHIQHLPSTALYASVVPADTASARAAANAAAVAAAANASMASTAPAASQSYALNVWAEATSDNRALDAQLRQLEQHIASTERAIAALHSAHPSLADVDVMGASEADTPFGATALGAELDTVLSRLVRATTGFNAAYTGALEPVVTGYVTCAEWHPHAAVPIPSSLLEANRSAGGTAGGGTGGSGNSGEPDRKQPPATPTSRSGAGGSGNGSSSTAAEPSSPDPFQTPVRNRLFRAAPSQTGARGAGSVAAVNLHSGLSESVASVSALHGTLRAVGTALRTLSHEYGRVAADAVATAASAAPATAAAGVGAATAPSMRVPQRLQALACAEVTESACAAMDDTIRVLQQSKARRRALNQAKR